MISAEELGATGKYTIFVYSDRIGDFTLKAVTLTDDDQNEKDIKQRIIQLEKELEAFRADLAKLEAKRKK